jgi:serine/threonine-protein kinase
VSWQTNVRPEAGTACLVCGAPGAGAAGPAVCPACRAHAREQAQPISDYQILRELGRGAMGVVHLAWWKARQTLVALKTVIPAQTDRLQTAHFLREADILRRLDHPNIVAFRALGEADGLLYFTMDFVRGTDADRLLKAGGPLPVGRAVRLVCQLLDALRYAHGLGFVHRDIKPSNFLVAAPGGGREEKVKLADFGLARVYQASALSGLTMTGDVGGTTAFMPPEQITNYRQAQPAADQYSAAATLYRLLTGKFIFDLPSGFEAQLLMILEQPPVPIRERRPDVPAPLAAAVHRALAKEPGRRFADVLAFRTALMPFAGSIEAGK